MKVGQVLAHLRQLEHGLADSLRSAADRHSDDHDVFHQCRTFAARATARTEKLPLASLEGDWRAALDLLAGVRDDGRRSLAAVLEDERAGLDAFRLYVVTANLNPRLADKLIAMQFGRIDTAVVWVDARSWARKAPKPAAPDGVALRLSRAGIPFARVRRGDDVRGALGAAPEPVHGEPAGARA